jgi:hypothetical protein
MPTSPAQDFQRVLSAVWRFGRAISYGLIGLLLLFIGLRIAEGFVFFQGLVPFGGYVFLAAIVVAGWWFVGRPVRAFLAVPPALVPPDLPPVAERSARDLERHLDFLSRYLESMLRNPEWEGSPEDVEAACRRVAALRAEAEGTGDVAAFSARVQTLERETVERLLAPVDRKARAIIRQEALAVGMATAISWNGALDAFIVLWRNLNLVSRLARVYYGRPGAWGTLRILRDVSGATLASASLQDVSHAAGGALGSLAGKGVGVLAGPLLDGAVNAVVTLRIGYVARGRCRAFQAWNERTRARVAKEAFVEAAAFSKEVVTEIIRTVGGGILRLPATMLGKVGDALSGLWRRWSGEAPESTPPQPA